jgi:DNA modification methylase
MKDCLVALAEIESESIDLILTDPPYNLGLFMKKRDTNLAALRENHFVGTKWDDETPETWAANMKILFEESARVLKKGGSLVIFMSIIKVESLIAMTEETKLYYKTTGIWHKTNPMPRNMNLHFINSTEAWVFFTNDKKTGTFNNQGKAIHDFIETAGIGVSEKSYGKHPTQKPVKLMEHFINLLTNPGDTVLDPFMGSGSSGVAAANLGRNFHGIESNPEYFEISKKRIHENLNRERLL